MKADRPTLTLSIDPTSEPIAGQLTLPDGSSAAFSGYMELAAALERLRKPMESTQPNDPDFGLDPPGDA